VAAANIIGARGLFVNAKDAAAAGFYTKYGFEPAEDDALRLFMLDKDIRKTLRHRSRPDRHLLTRWSHEFIKAIRPFCLG
jgi:predicted acetyltransferase